MILKTSSFKWATVLLVATVSVSAPLWAASKDVGAQAQRASEPPISTVTWSAQDLQRIIKADDLKGSPFREDGVTYGTPTWVWCDEVDGALYVRAYSGTASRWYQAAITQKAGRVRVDGVDYEVTFEDAGSDDEAAIDAAYEAKYGSAEESFAVPIMQGEGPKGASVRVSPR